MAFPPNPVSLQVFILEVSPAKSYTYVLKMPPTKNEEEDQYMLGRDYLASGRYVMTPKVHI